MDKVERYLSILSTVGDLDMKHIHEQLYKYAPFLCMIESEDELNAGIEYAQRNGISLINNMKTFERYELVRCVQNSLNQSFDSVQRGAM